MIEIIPYIILAIEDDGDREFMAWLYIQYQSLLYSEIIRIVQSSTDAEDVLHTVIENLIDKVGFLRKLDRRGLVNYIITAAKNTAYNYCRDKKKELDFDFEQEVIVDITIRWKMTLLNGKIYFALTKFGTHLILKRNTCLVLNIY